MSPRALDLLDAQISVLGVGRTNCGGGRCVTEKLQSETNYEIVMDRDSALIVIVILLLLV